MLNSDFTTRVAIHAGQMDWTPSPVPGLGQRTLHHAGEEVACATFIVRHGPGSHVASHPHHGGEEFLVLEGVFQDEHGDFPTGSYVRMPPTSSHAPRSELGCTLFVKLGQFNLDDRTEVNLDTALQAFAPVEARPGVGAIPLFADLDEQVRLERWTAGAVVNLHAPGGVEVLVLEGSFTEGGERFRPQSWLRLPAGSVMQARAGGQGCCVWIKAGCAKNANGTPRGHLSEELCSGWQNGRLVSVAENGLSAVSRRDLG